MNLLAERFSRRPELSLSCFNLLFAVWLTIGLNTNFFKHLAEATNHTGISYALFVFANILIVTALYNLIFQIVHWKVNVKLFNTIWIVIGGLAAYFVNNLGVAITSDQIQNMMQTDHQEAFDLFNFRFLIWCVSFIFLPLSVLYFVRIKQENLNKVLWKKVANILGSLIMIGSLLFVYYLDYASIFRQDRELKSMLSPQNVVGSSWSYYKKQRPKENLPLLHYGEDAHVIENVKTKTTPKIMVLVVGETARAESFSLNGYQKNTNHNLSKIDLINFSLVSSCGTATAVSVPCMFSGMTRANYDPQLASHRENLLDIAKQAGYKVTWIDNNSGCKNVCNRVEQFVIPDQIKSKWCDKEECRDEILIESLNAYLENLPADDHESHLIVLHQMGSHGPAYYKRTTDEHAPFKPTCDTNAIQSCSQQELLNSYDNSIVYTDYVLSQLIHHLASVDRYQTAFWYLSDHGESTGEHGMYLHGAPYAFAPTQQTHVPMIMWFSDQWKQQQKAQINCLIAQKNNSLSQDNLFPTMLSLLDIKTDIANLSLDMLQQCNNTNKSA